jgi:hypothetical protein
MASSPDFLHCLSCINFHCLYAFTCSVHPISLYLITLIIFGEENKLGSFSLRKFYFQIVSSLLGLQLCVPKHPQFMFFMRCETEFFTHTKQQNCVVYRELYSLVYLKTLYLLLRLYISVWRYECIVLCSLICVYRRFGRTDCGRLRYRFSTYPAVSKYSFFSFLLSVFLSFLLILWNICTSNSASQ